MTVQPTLNLNFAQARFPDPRMTFTRASSGTYIDALGRVQTAAVNQPRFEWDPVTGQCSGLLIEGQRTNLLTYSEDFSKSAWIKARATVTTPAIESPDPLSMATKLVADTQSGAHYIEQQFSAQVQEYVFQVFVKAAEEVMVRLYLVDPSGSITVGSPALFDLSTGQVVSGPGSIADLGGGWYRIATRGTVGAAGNARARLLLRDGTPYVGNGVDGLYIWGAQLEEGTYPTSYIPTTDSPATRAADSPVIPVTTFPFNPSEGTLIAEVNPGTIGVEKTVAMLTDGTPNEQIRLIISNTGQPRVLIRTGNVDIFYPTFGPISEGRAVIAGSWSEQGCHFAVNGNVTSGAGAVPQVSDLYPGRFFNNTSPLNGHISRLLYFPRALDAATLARLTA